MGYLQLVLDPDASSLRSFAESRNDQKRTLAIGNSFVVGFVAALIATVLGTVVAVGLASPWMPYKQLIAALLLDCTGYRQRGGYVLLLGAVQPGLDLCGPDHRACRLGGAIRDYHRYGHA
ncbi:hypothetical protein [Yoonia sp. SS1-5]|uniref:Uncharacterized protein n=1 Tax=Yoonia rhodophyticola TaxID=3137370 RepID=A0AAN0ML27_9RHOB